MKNAVAFGAFFLIVIGILHAFHVGRADDVEPYLWAASLFLVSQGILTLVYLRRKA